MKKILITICVAVGVYFAFSNTIDEFLYPEKRPGLNTYDTPQQHSRPLPQLLSKHP